MDIGDGAKREFEPQACRPKYGMWSARNGNEIGFVHARGDQRCHCVVGAADGVDAALALQASCGIDLGSAKAARALVDANNIDGVC